MAHWRVFLDSDVIRYVDLDGKDYDVKITAIKKDKVKGSGGKTTGKAFLTLEGREKPLACGTETLAQIAALYGNDTRAWIGKWITLWPDPTVKYGGQAVGGVRVRPKAPQPETKAAAK